MSLFRWLKAEQMHARSEISRLRSVRYTAKPYDPYQQINSWQQYLHQTELLLIDEEIEDIKKHNEKKKQNDKQEYIKIPIYKKGDIFIKDSDVKSIVSKDEKIISERNNKLSSSNEESSSGSYLILALLLLPLMTLPMPLAFLFYGLLSWLWLGTSAMLKIFLVCTTVYLYSSGYIFFGSLMLFMTGVISFIILKKDIGSPSLSSMKGLERFKFRKRRNLVAIIWLVFCLLVAYQPDFVFVMMLIAIPFFIGYFFYLVGNNLI